MDNSVSVVMPAYNSAATIARAIDCVLSQTLRPMELLVCDDGSDDETVAIARGRVSDDHRCRVLTAAHSGKPAVPRNRGIAEARGRWIAFCDADDFWLDDKLERQIDFLSASGCRAASSNAWRIDKDGASRGVLLAFGEERIRVEHLLRVNSVICSSAVVDSSLVREAGGFPRSAGLRAMEDYALWLRVSTRTAFAYCKIPLLRYTDSPSTSIRGTRRGSDNLRKLAVYVNFVLWALRGNGAPAPVIVRAIRRCGTVALRGLTESTGIRHVKDRGGA